MKLTALVGSARKFATAIAITLAVVLLLMALWLVIYDEHSYRRQEAAEATSEARILAETVTAALSFEDRAAATEYVNALEGNSEVRAAAVYDANGKLFASYARDPRNDQLPSLLTQLAAVMLGSDRLLRMAPVVE